MTIPQYKIRYAYSARNDVAGIKKYVLIHFKYRQLVENFKKKMLKMEKGLTTFLRVLQDGMNWKYIIGRWLKDNN